MVNQPNRLGEGGAINRDRAICFWFDGRRYYGYHGDTLASALLANGVKLVARSFKYHRPRGIFSAGSEEPNALVQLETGGFTEPNRRATEIELYDGLVAHSQNRWPNLRFDIGAVNSYLWRILPAGFYYKTFMWPPSLWLFYEKWIRRAAGLGRSPLDTDPDYYDKFYYHTDVLVVGGGAAGLQAAHTAGKSGAQVLLVDEKNEFGGALLYAGDEYKIDGNSAREWLDKILNELRAMDNVKLAARTTISGYYDYNFLVACERVNGNLPLSTRAGRPKERLWKIRAGRVVLATGAIERPLVFADNDRPGVMLASAVRAYINRFAVLPGKLVLIFTNNDSAYLTALDVLRAGGEAVVIDARAATNSELVATAKQQGITIQFNKTISGIRYCKGRICAAEVMELSPAGDAVYGVCEILDCDIVAASGGWIPTLNLLSQSGGQMKFDADLHCFIPNARGGVQADNKMNNINYCAGACAGAATLAECLHQGAEAGAAAAGVAMPGGVAVAEPKLGAPRALWIMPCDHPIGRGAKKHFHELQNDSTIADIDLAAREGFAAEEHLKRYTTTGMGTDQGKTSNLNALVALAQLRNVDINTLTPTTFRPPYTPLTFGAIVGQERRDLFIQKRTTPMHAWHIKSGAVFEDVGDWKRPYYYPKSGESMTAAVNRECVNVRKNCGLLDASTLGKIDIRGKDATRFLNMIYTNAWDNLSIGKCRYGVMLNEHGMVFDDGVTTRLGEAHFHMTTTTGGAARVLNWLEEYLQTEWRDWQVYCTSVSEQWAVASLNGPRSRELLQTLTDDNLDDENFPFMSMRELNLGGIAARVFRISFSGELSFEINVAARFGQAAWEMLMRAGEEFGICAYGTEAMHILRAEKGFIIVGQDTDGTVTPLDLGMDWLVSKKKKDFLGRRALSRSDTARAGRKQLVGLKCEDPTFIIPEGTHLVLPNARKANSRTPTIGHVTSSYMSAHLRHSIALALLENGLHRHGEQVEALLLDGSCHKVNITSPIFLDPKGELARG